MKKNILILFLILIPIISLFGCKDTSIPTTTTIATTTTTVATTSTTTTSTTTTTIALGTITGIIDLIGQSDDSRATVAVVGTSLSATTASNGSFTISNVTANSYSLTITKSGFVTSNTSNVVVTAGASTDVGTIIIYQQAVEYSLSHLNGTLSALSYIDGNLYIATIQSANSSWIYKIEADNISNIKGSYETTTKNYTSLLAWEEGLTIYITGLAEKDASTMYIDDFLAAPLTLEESNTDPLPGFQAATDLNADFIVYYYNNSFIKSDFEHPTQNVTWNVNETGINSLYNGNNNYYYASNPTTIYKYNSSFGTPSSLASSSVGGGTNTIGIAFDGTYIWFIDSVTKKLYKINDIL